MKKTLKEHRQERHMSQQELTDLSRVFLRTIQRLEKNISSGSPYVLRSLSQALGIQPNNLLRDSIYTQDKFKEDVKAVPFGKKYIKYINISSLSILLFPFLNLAIVTIVYFIYRQKL